MKNDNVVFIAIDKSVNEVCENFNCKPNFQEELFIERLFPKIKGDWVIAKNKAPETVCCVYEKEVVLVYERCFWENIEQANGKIKKRFSGFINSEADFLGMTGVVTPQQGVTYSYNNYEKNRENEQASKIRNKLLDSAKSLLNAKKQIILYGASWHR